MKRARLQLRRAQRGFALVDFLTGTAIFAGALVGFTALTQSKFDVIHQTGDEQMVQAHLEEALDALRRSGLSALGQVDPSQVDPAKVDVDGFQTLSEKQVTLGRLGPVTQLTSSRLAHSFDSAGKQLVETDAYEVRILLRWRGGVRSLSTLVPRKPQ